MKLYDLRDELLELSDADRANLLALIAREEVSRPYKATRADSELWQALTQLSPHSPHRTLDSFLKDKHGLSRQEWSSAVAYLGAFTEDVEPVRHRDEDRAALVGLALHCLTSDMHGRGIEVTPKRIIEQLPRLRTAVDAAFPGYIEAGLLHMLIRLSPSEPVAAE